MKMRTLSEKRYPPRKNTPTAESAPNSMNALTMDAARNRSRVLSRTMFARMNPRYFTGSAFDVSHAPGTRDASHSCSNEVPDPAQRRLADGTNRRLYIVRDRVRGELPCGRVNDLSGSASASRYRCSSLPPWSAREM